MHLSTIWTHTHVHNLSNFMLLHSITFGTEFSSSACIKVSPSRTSVKDLQNSSLKDTPGRGSSFHHSFHSGEQVLKMTISLPQPILLHSLHIYQPSGLTQSKHVTVIWQSHDSHVTDKYMITWYPVVDCVTLTHMCCVCSCRWSLLGSDRGVSFNQSRLSRSTFSSDEDYRTDRNQIGVTNTSSCSGMCAHYYGCACDVTEASLLSLSGGGAAPPSTSCNRQPIFITHLAAGHTIQITDSQHFLLLLFLLLLIFLFLLIIILFIYQVF